MEKLKLNIIASDEGLKYTVKVKGDKELFYRKRYVDMWMLKGILNSISSNILKTDSVITTSGKK